MIQVLDNKRFPMFYWSLKPTKKLDLCSASGHRQEFKVLYEVLATNSVVFSSFSISLCPGRGSSHGTELYSQRL